MNMRAPSAAESGFTLVELLIGFAVMAVLLVLAAPSFTSMIEMQRLRGTHDQLTADMQFMRTEAVSRQEVTGISFAENAAMSCTPAAPWMGRTASATAGRAPLRRAAWRRGAK
jgi:type IV fimbrial biogenesis protein FimT